MSPRHIRPGRAVVAALVSAVLLAGCATSSDGSGRPTVTGDPATERIPVIVDTDLDLSDVAALAVLLRDPGVDVRAITIVPTGTGVTNCASGRRVANYLLEEFGATHVPFACGREDPGTDGRRFPDDWRGAADSGWGIPMPSRPQSTLPEEAVAVLARTVAESPSAPTIVALGPWTNLEEAIAADPTFADRVAGIHAMAGAVDVPGNVIVDEVTADDGLEWNLAADPSAVDAVMDTDAPITIVPLDATQHVPVPADLAERLAAASPGAGADLVGELLLRVPTRVGEGQQLWDELAALALTDPELVSWNEAGLLAEPSGRLVRAELGRPVRFAAAVDDPEAVLAALVAALERGPARTTPFELAGTLAVTWDGTTCAMTATEQPRPGVATLTFEATEPGGVQVIGIREPHTWSEVQPMLGSLDVETGVIPDWVVEAGGANDEAGSGRPVTGTAQLTAGTYGPVCLTGAWPDITLRAGEPIVVVGG